LRFLLKKIENINGLEKYYVKNCKNHFIGKIPFTFFSFFFIFLLFKMLCVLVFLDQIVRDKPKFVKVGTLHPNNISPQA